MPLPTVGQGGPGEGESLPSIKADLDKLDTFKSAGPDGLHPPPLRELASIIAQPLAWILESSWRSGEVPNDWKRPMWCLSSRKGGK